jgi:hypothetical protein
LILEAEFMELSESDELCESPDMADHADASDSLDTADSVRELVEEGAFHGDQVPAGWTSSCDAGKDAVEAVSDSFSTASTMASRGAGSLSGGEFCQRSNGFREAQDLLAGMSTGGEESAEPWAGLGILSLYLRRLTLASQFRI